MAVAMQMEFRGGTLDQYDQVMDKMGLRPAPDVRCFDVHNYL